MNSDTYYTPEWILKPLGEFDLDPCTPKKMLWETAKHRYTEEDNGLIQPWFGRVWLNPPYSNIEPWMKLITEHGNGIALINATTDTNAFFNYGWYKADGMLFLKGRVRFYTHRGYRGGQNRDGSVLLGYGKYNEDVLASAEKELDGFFVSFNTKHLIVVTVSGTWLSVIELAVTRHGSDEELKPIYDLVEHLAPDKIRKNPHWKAKVRQQIQVIRRKRHGKEKATNV